MKKMIITADDYGMSRAVNDAIDACINAGNITSTNVMTNMPFYKEAEKLKEKKGVSVGLHWVLTCGKPILAPNEIPSLVTNDGQFYPYSEFRKRFRNNLISFNDIKNELVAQYNLFFDVLGSPDYWNTHQNVHVDFEIYRLFVDVAVELGIDRMRSHQRVYVKGSVKSKKKPLVWRVVEPIKSRLLDRWQHNAHKKGIKSPDGLVVCLNNEDTNNIEYLFNHIEWCGKDVAEFVIHPAVRNDSPYFGNLVEQRIKEYEMFVSQEVNMNLQENNIELVSYEQI